MTANRNTALLNRLLILLNRSLPQYLRYAGPAWSRGEERLRETLDAVASDQSQLVDRIGALIVDRGGNVAHGDFPIVYTGYHDLSADFLVRRVVAELKQSQSQLRAIAAGLGGDLEARVLAEEALGAAQGHLDNLRELTGATAGASAAAGEK